MFGLKKASISLYDSAAGDAVKEIGASAIDKRAALAATQDMRKTALSIALQLADDISEGALDDSELPSERLDALMAGALGLDDGKADDVLVQMLSAHIADALSSLQVPDDMIADIFSDDVDTADSAIESMADIVLANLPSAGDALDNFVKAFAYGFSEPDMSDAEDMVDGGADESDEYDSIPGKPKKKLGVGQKTIKKVNGHTIQYKAVKAVRNGKIVTVNKRISGTLVLTAKQKASMHKLHARPHTSAMMMKALRSLMKGDKARIYKGKGAGSLIKGARLDDLERRKTY